MESLKKEQCAQRQKGIALQRKWPMRHLFLTMTGKKLLVADDSLTIQKVIKLALSNEGYQILTVSDGNDALTQITLHRPDAVLIDVSLPNKTAFEVKRAINEMGDYPEVRFVLMSSAFERYDEAEAQAVGMDARLTKPFEPGQLRQILNEVLAKTIAKRTEKTAFIEKLPEPPKIHLDPPSEDYSTDYSQDLPHDLPQDLPQDLPMITPAEAPIVEEYIEPPVGELWEQTQKTQFTVTPPKMPMPPAFTMGSKSTPPPMSPSPELEIEVGSNPETDIRKLTESTIRMSGLDDFDWTINEPVNEPAVEAPSFSTPMTSAPSFSPPPPPYTQSTIPAPEALTIPPPPTLPGSYGNVEYGANDMEEIIRKQVHEQLEKMAKAILPQIAERLIKQEIHKMLQEETH